MNSVVIIGLGNPLMSDEGVGIRLLHELAARPSDLPGVDFVDAGTSSMRALHAMAGRRKAVLVDCAFMGEKPGAIRRFTPDEAASAKRLPRLSLHEGDLMDAIRLSRQLGECPPEVVIFGIEPAAVEMGNRLSGVCESAIGRYLEAIRGEAMRREAG